MTGAAEERPARKAVEKAPGAFRTISEVATDLDVPQHVLRFWESKFAQVRPLKRGGGRRYYRPEDVDLLRFIRALLYEQGYTIRGVQKVLKEQGRKGSDDAGEATPDAGGGGLSADQRKRLATVLRELTHAREQLRKALG
jgi:DNA-binding transcriptional MerR regulator